MKELLESDVLIIGAGILGMGLARELTKYQLSVAAIEKEADVSMGISKTAGSLVYMGLFQALSLVIKDLGRGADLEAETKTERMRMLWEGFSEFDGLAHQLDIAHKHPGLMVIARNSRELQKLDSLEHLAQFVPGGTVRRLDRDEMFRMEPNLTPDAVAGLQDTTGAISLFGPEYVIALFENARQNGAKILFNTECVKIERDGGYHIVHTTQGKIRSRFVVNCAGKYADRVADMADARSDWRLVFYRSQALLLDRKLEGTITNVIGIPPDSGKIDFLYPLLEGNIHVYGANYDLIEDREFTATTSENYEDAIRRMKTLVPSLSEESIIASYVGVRAFHDKELDENYIAYAPNNPHFVNVIARMPGFTPATRIADKVVHMMEAEGLALRKKADFNGVRKGIPRFRFLADEERDALIREDPLYGRVICRCETVTEGEIVEAIRRGASTVQGIMFRTRAGMGRCQRNWCGPKLMEILGRQLGHSRQDVTFKGRGYEMLAS